MCLTITDRNGSVHNADRDPVMPWIIRWGGKEEWRRVLLNRDGSYGHTMMTSYDEVKINLPRQVNGHWYSQLQRTLYMIVDDTVFEEMYDGKESRDESENQPRKAGMLELNSPTSLSLTEESNKASHEVTRNPNTPWTLTLHLFNEQKQWIADPWYKVLVKVNLNGGHYVWEITHDNETIIRPRPKTTHSELQQVANTGGRITGLAALAVGTFAHPVVGVGMAVAATTSTFHKEIHRELFSDGKGRKVRAFKPGSKTSAAPSMAARLGEGPPTDLYAHQKKTRKHRVVNEYEHIRRILNILFGKPVDKKAGDRMYEMVKMLTDFEITHPGGLRQFMDEHGNHEDEEQSVADPNKYLDEKHVVARASIREQQRKDDEDFRKLKAELALRFPNAWDMDFYAKYLKAYDKVHHMLQYEEADL